MYAMQLQVQTKVHFKTVHRIHLLPKNLAHSMCQVSLVVKYISWGCKISSGHHVQTLLNEMADARHFFSKT